jgi:pimeloyl-ACP methyl ester carboxylesterase
LEWLKIPVLILQADKIHAIALPKVKPTLIIPQAQLEIISNAGHDLPQALPDVVAQYIRAFVSSQ